MADLKFFRCKKCGSVVVKLNAKGCDPSCCGEPMAELKGNTSDGAKEKHVPDVTVDGDKISVQVGSVAHPMLDEHYIEWIYLQTAEGGQFKCLKPGAEPKAEFKAADGIAVWEYCNLHGLWKKDL